MGKREEGLAKKTDEEQKNEKKFDRDGSGGEEDVNEDKDVPIEV